MHIPKPVVLCILDGWGARASREGNAPAQAHTPAFDHIMASCPNATLITHGPDVGLPRGQMGNSEGRTPPFWMQWPRSKRPEGRCTSLALYRMAACTGT